jgi:hypothetical protein
LSVWSAAVPRKRKQVLWEIIKLKASPALFVGTVYAVDEDSAFAQAVIELKVDPDKRYIVRRAAQ